LETSSSDKEGANNISDGPEDGLVYHHAIITITQSLTRTEGNVLSKTFLSPWDFEGGGGKFVQLWAAMGMAGAIVLIGRRSG
jgi:hypothetical protein